MSTITDLLASIRIVLDLIKKYIDDPKKKLKAIQEYRDKLRDQMKEILNEENMGKVDDLIIDWILLIHEL